MNLNKIERLDLWELVQDAINQWREQVEKLHEEEVITTADYSYCLKKVNYPLDILVSEMGIDPLLEKTITDGQSIYGMLNREVRVIDLEQARELLDFFVSHEGVWTIYAEDSQELTEFALGSLEDIVSIPDSIACYYKLDVEGFVTAYKQDLNREDLLGQRYYYIE